MNAGPRLALLHPGAMGASVGACARAAGCTVSWCEAGRGDATRRRARDAGLVACPDLDTLLSGADIVLSVCPPAHALEVARAVAARAYRGLYVDANAIAPDTAAAVARTVVAAGASYVDGGIIGPPAGRAGSTRLYLSGTHAARVVPCFAGSALEAIDLGAAPGAASALKMAYAAWTKGSAALLLATAAMAEASGTRAALAAEWARSQPGLEARLVRIAADNAPKAWRFTGEMAEISRSFAACGLPADFHHAAGAVYAALAGFRDAAPAPDVDAVLRALLERS